MLLTAAASPAARRPLPMPPSSSCAESGRHFARPAAGRLRHRELGDLVELRLQQIPPRGCVERRRGGRRLLRRCRPKPRSADGAALLQRPAPGVGAAGCGQPLAGAGLGAADAAAGCAIDDCANAPNARSVASVARCTSSA